MFIFKKIQIVVTSIYTRVLEEQNVAEGGVQVGLEQAA